MMSAIDHVLLTRFNLPSRGAERFIRAREHWLRSRMELFERFCVPSVRSQNVANLHWIIYLDPQSPSWLIARMTELSESGLCSPIYREEVPRPDLLADLHSVVGVPGDRLVTTNLDNDDALAVDFSTRVQSVAEGASRRAIYIDDGLILCGGAVYLRRDRHNAFCSVAESWDSPGTCWTTWHNELDRKMPVAHVGGGPGWLQVVHGDNVSNRVRGRLVPADPYRPLFPGLISDIARPKFSATAADRLLHGPRRGLRETGRAAAKRLVLSIGGRDGMDIAHARWNALRARAHSVSTTELRERARDESES